jgi:hypothetical protein
MAFQSSRSERRSSEEGCVLFRGVSLGQSFKRHVRLKRDSAYGARLREGCPLTVRRMRSEKLINAICPRRGYVTSGKSEIIFQLSGIGFQLSLLKLNIKKSRRSGLQLWARL